MYFSFRTARIFTTIVHFFESKHLHYYIMVVHYYHNIVNNFESFPEYQWEFYFESNVKQR